jgi:phosphatidylglycerophosphatase C
VGERRIAAFDFDGTITSRDTLLPFLARTCGRRTFSRALRRAGRAAAATRLGLGAAPHHRDASKEVLLKDLLAGRSADWLAEVGHDYAEAVLPGQVRPEMLDQIRWHRDHGHELVLVSASLHAYLGPFGRAHGFAEAIAVTLEVDPAGMLTGALDRPNVRGPEKARRLREWLDGDTPAYLWGYGNSSGDRELLAMVDQPVWIGRRRRPLDPPVATATRVPAT